MNWISLTSKLAGLILSVVVLMAVIMGVSIAIQSAYGYYAFELGLYLEGLFARQLPFWIEVSILSLAVQEKEVAAGTLTRQSAYELLQ